MCLLIRTDFSGERCGQEPLVYMYFVCILLFRFKNLPTLGNEDGLLFEYTWLLLNAKFDRKWLAS